MTASEPPGPAVTVAGARHSKSRAGPAQGRANLKGRAARPRAGRRVLVMVV